MDKLPCRLGVTSCMRKWWKQQKQSSAGSSPVFVFMVFMCWKRKGEVGKTQHSSLRLRPQEVSVMFPGITSACLFVCFLWRSLRVVTQCRVGAAESPLKNYKNKWMETFKQRDKLLGNMRQWICTVKEMLQIMRKDDYLTYFHHVFLCSNYWF